jgi:hypothetical protein
MGYHFLRASVALVLICGSGAPVSAEPKNKAKAPAVYRFGDIMTPVDFVPRPRAAVQAPDPLSPEALADITGSVTSAQAEPKK